MTPVQAALCMAEKSSQPIEKALRAVSDHATRMQAIYAYLEAGKNYGLAMASDRASCEHAWIAGVCMKCGTKATPGSYPRIENVTP